MFLGLYNKSNVEKEEMINVTTTAVIHCISNSILRAHINQTEIPKANL